MIYDEYESDSIEYKKLLSKKDKQQWLKKVAGLANGTLGGKLIVGVEDKDHTIVGVDKVDETIDLFCTEVSRCISPVIKYIISVESYDDKNVVVFSINPGSTPPYILKISGDQRIYVMKGNTTVDATNEDLIEMALRAKNLTWDQLDSQSSNEPSFKVLGKNIEKYSKEN